MAGTLSLPTTGTLSGLTMVQDTNAALAGLAVLNAAGTAPTANSTGLTSIAGLVWRNTATGVIALRDQADTGWMPWAQVNEAAQVVTPLIGLGQCRLSVAGPSSLKLSPHNGNRVCGPGWSAVIPGSGITANPAGCYLDGTAGQALAASTVYYVYLAVIGGVLALDFSTNSHAIDGNSGIEIKSGDASRLLLGMVYTDGAAHFADTAGYRGCLNWFNRRDLALAGSLVSPSGTVASASELAGGPRIHLLSWGDEDTHLYVTGSVFDASAPGEYCSTGIGIDTLTGFSSDSVNVGALGDCTVLHDAMLSEGHHYATIIGQTSGAGAGSWNVRLRGSVRG